MGINCRVGKSSVACGVPIRAEMRCEAQQKADTKMLLCPSSTSLAADGGDGEI